MTILAVVPSLPVRVTAPGRVLLTQKFVEGMAQYAAQWNGPVVAVMHPHTGSSTGNLDDAEFELAGLPFGVRCASFLNQEVCMALDDATVVMLGGDSRLSGLPQWCLSRGKHPVFVTEYSLRTRLQIIKAEVRNPLVRLRRYLWEWQQEQHNRRSVKRVAAVQCNGIPTYDVYCQLNPNTLLYLDSRITSGMLATTDTLSARARHRRENPVIRLAFSGRLNAMKGADDLVVVARHLHRDQIPFSLEIFGDGPLHPSIAEQIQADGLQPQVQLRGVLDFATELLPHVRDNVDLFVCCHRQGDPSCTYLETFACGVPIVGYANEALQGLTRLGAVGWTTPLNRPEALARQIAELQADPEALAAASRTALDFARAHTFEQEFESRMNQIKALVIA